MVLTLDMGLIYIDANVFVAAFESDPVAAAPARDLFMAAQGSPHRLITSELTIAEVLAPASAPGSLSASKKLEIYQTVLVWGDLVELIPVSRAILFASASIRVDYRQKLPDAIHVATALEADCRYFCSSDRDARRLPPALRWVAPNVAGLPLLVAALRA